MKRILLAGLVLVVLFPLSLPSLSAAPRKRAPAPAKPPATERFVPDEVLVQFKAGMRPDVVAAAVGARVQGRIGDLDVHILKVPSGTVEATVRALANNPLVEFAEPNGYMYALYDVDDPYADRRLPSTSCYPSAFDGCARQWAWGAVKAFDAWGTPPGVYGTPTVRVAVIDTGIDISHEDLPPVELKSYVYGETGEDDDGHGTHVAGIIAAVTNNAKGVAGAMADRPVKLIAVKVLDFTGSGTWSAVAKGINWAVTYGQAKVINLSLGGGPSKTVKRAVDNAWSKGAVLACAAGNGGDTAPSYPGAYTNCIAVSATNSADNRASFSTYGDWVDVAAPGEDILSTMIDDFIWCFLCYWYGYNTTYEVLSGTSMATPHVAGLAALIWASGVCPISDNVCVRSHIETYADYAAKYGVANGRVNYYRALTESPPSP